MSKKRSQEPLLFINLPSKTPSNYNMQEIYTNKHEKEQNNNEDLNKKKLSPAKKEVSNEPMSNDTGKKEAPVPHGKNATSSFSRVKPFKQMDLKERLEYLVNFPKVLPPVPCVLYTLDNKYQGYLTEFADNLVTIQFQDQTTKILPFEEIKNVIMIGIKR